MFNDEEPSKKRVLFQPLILPHFIMLLFLAFFLLPIYIFFLIPVFRYGLGLPSFLVFMVIWFSLLGSAVNFPVKEVVSNQPVVFQREVSFFGFKWVFPEITLGKQKTIIAVNLGGAIVPILVSIYLLVYSIPVSELNPTLTYLKILIVTILVARVIPGLGIALPGFIPPLLTTIATLIVFRVYVLSNPYIIGYISGTMGTLIGADLLNLHKITRLGVPMVSIGGAGTFDGIFLTGVVSVFLLLLFV